jgi:hypothetical protein
MSDVTIELPQCHKSFKLNDILAAPSTTQKTLRKLEPE